MSQNKSEEYCLVVVVVVVEDAVRTSTRNADDHHNHRGLFSLSFHFDLLALAPPEPGIV